MILDQPGPVNAQGLDKPLVVGETQFQPGAGQEQDAARDQRQCKSRGQLASCLPEYDHACRETGECEKFQYGWRLEKGEQQHDSDRACPGTDQVCAVDAGDLQIESQHCHRNRIGYEQEWQREKKIGQEQPLPLGRVPEYLERIERELLNDDEHSDRNNPEQQDVHKENSRKMAQAKGPEQHDETAADAVA